MIKDLLLDFINRRKNTKIQEIEISEEEIINFDPKGEMWKKVLKFVRSDKISLYQIEELIAALGRKEETSIAKHVKDEIEKNSDYSNDIRRMHPNLTALELKICTYIVRDKKSEEICKLMNVGLSTITAYRCRIRKKMKLKKGENLKTYLGSISRYKRSPATIKKSVQIS